MRTVTDLLAAPALRDVLRQLAGPEREAAAAVLCEELDELAGAPAGAVVLLTAGASRTASGYRLDMALRVAGSRSVAAVVLTDGRTEMPATALTIADRALVAVLAAPRGCDLAGLLLSVHRELTGGAETAVARLAGVLGVLREAEDRGADVAALVEAGSAALGRPLQCREPEEGEIAVPIGTDGEATGMLCAARRGGHDDTVTEATASLVAAAVTRTEMAARQAEEVPVRSRGELLTEFLLAGPDQADRLLQRLRFAGLAIDSWHAVVRIEVEALDALTGNDEVASFQLRQRLGTIALEAAHSVGGTWHRAQVGAALLLVRMQRRDPTSRSGPELTRVAAEVLTSITTRMPDVPLVCGVGTVHQGAAGLRASAAEAHAAVATARARRRLNAPVAFDGVGLQRTLIEWYASDTAREVVESLLQPLERLGGQKAETAIRTLQTYLDHGGSLTRTAEALHLHPNSVDYRIQRIFSALDVDSSDPETRLMLQLACRARLLR